MDANSQHCQLSGKTRRVQRLIQQLAHEFQNPFKRTDILKLSSIYGGKGFCKKLTTFKISKQRRRLSEKATPDIESKSRVKDCLDIRFEQKENSQDKQLYLAKTTPLSQPTSKHANQRNNKIQRRIILLPKQPQPKKEVVQANWPVTFIDFRPRRQSLFQSPRKQQDSPSKLLTRSNWRNQCHRLTKIENLIKSYSLKIGRQESTKYFVFNSKDEYIRRVLEHWGWVQNKTPSTLLYNLKWVYTDSNQDYKLQEGQLINHFHKNHHLTTKNGLRRSLLSYVSEFGLGVHQFYPRTFQLSFSADLVDFSFQFLRLKVSTYLRRLGFLLKQIWPAQYNQMKELDELRQGPLSQHPEDPFLLQFTKACKSIRVYMRQGLNYFQIEQLNSKIGQMQVLPDYVRDRQPDTAFIYRVIKESRKFQSLVGPAWHTEGDSEVWIVKPCGNARGNGISLVRGREAALRVGQSVLRVIQKYIERPLLLRECKEGDFNGRKFDIRQWVLVTSLRPLKVYLFSGCYLRFCSQPYRIDDLENKHVHLTNYSQNKETANSYMLLQTFKQQLLAQEGVCWETAVKPQIQLIVLDTIRASAANMTHSPNSFQLYGFDILLDEQCHAWLLQVNLSPACQERGEDLRQMLQTMGEKLLRNVTGGGEWKSKQHDKYQWQNIVRPQRWPGLEVIGKSMVN